MRKSTQHTAIPPLLAMGTSWFIISPCRAALAFSLNRQEEVKQKGIFRAYGYRWPWAMNCKGQTRLCPLQLPHSSKFCWVTEEAECWWTETQSWEDEYAQGSTGSKATELENMHIHQTGNAIKMWLAGRQSHPGHSALHRFVINYLKTGLARNTLLFLRHRRPLLQFSGGCHRQTQLQIAD